MTENKLDRELAVREFEYGNHSITIRVGVEHARLPSHIPMDSDGRYDLKWAYYRYVTVEAIHPDGGTEVSNTERVRLSDACSPRKAITLPVIGELTIREQQIPPTTAEQIERTTRPVFEELDEIYQFTDKEIEVDVEVGVETVEHDISWVEVEDEMERLSREIDEIAHAPARGQ